MSNSIIVLCGAGASGKDTTLNILKQKYPNLQGCVSHTTRPMRQTEEEGREYFFIDKEEFEAMYENGQFIETRSYNVVGNETWYYNRYTYRGNFTLRERSYYHDIRFTRVVRIKRILLKRLRLIFMLSTLT